ncbi:TraK domain-containing protein, partial [Thalassospira sp. CH_XMU1420-2]|uniref:TraK domain-containing protein n=1 Tax=Thalassospira sp. CH_XMU1420-2 TaxID=3107769 RepID=UPI003009787C
SNMHMNRLVTPFERPEIVTTDQAKFQHRITGNSIFFQPKGELRSVIYVREKGTEDPVIQLGIAGNNVVPRQIALEFGDGEYFRPHGGRKTSESSGMAMTASSVMQQVRAEFTKVAQMSVPDGFNIVQRAARLPEFCMNHNGVTFSFKGGQKLSGADYDIYVGLVDNQTPSNVQLDETWCATEDVIAVAFWEDVLLPPGHQSEVYVAARHQEQPTYNERRSLLRGGN